MLQHERMIEGVGFYFHSKTQTPRLPTFDDLRSMVQEVAYFKWINAGGRPDTDPQQFWLEAERDLFFGLHRGGYTIHVCDLDLPENKGHLRHWDMLLVTPEGATRIVTR